ncbi:Asx homology domain-containing protein [Xylaria curta]|nr:Asx homology domain-containing protein [Xylaria curta]
MPPRKTPLASRTRSDDDSALVSSTPKRMTRSHRARQMNTTPISTSLSKDELNTGVGPCDTTQAGAEEEVVLDEIIVSAAPRNARATDVDSSSQAVAFKNSAETPRPLRRSSRTPSISQGGSAFPSPSGRGVPIKKQDFLVGIAADDDGKPDELSDPPTAKKRKVEPKSTKRAARKSRSKWDTPDEMLTDPNAPLAKANLRELLCSPKAWDILTQEEREKILAKFPDDVEILDPDTPDARPDIAALRNNNNFRHDVARYQEGLSKGFHDPEWIQQAQAAHRSREMGFYDEFMATDFEERWGMPMPQQSYVGSDGSGSRQASHASDGEVNDTHIELKTSEDTTNQSQENNNNNNTVEFQSAGIRHENPPEVHVRDRSDSFDGTNGNKIENVNDISKVKNRGVQLPGSNDKQAAPNQVEAVTTQHPPDSSDQKVKDHNRGVEVSSIPSLPAVTDVAGPQHEEKLYEINEEASSAGVQDVAAPT